MTMLTFLFVITVILDHHLDAKGMFHTLILLQVKFGYSEKATKFEKSFHLKFDITE